MLWLVSEVLKPPDLLHGTHLFSRSVSDSRPMGLGHGLPDVMDPSGDPSTPTERGVTALLGLLWSKGEAGYGGEAQSGQRGPAVDW